MGDLKAVPESADGERERPGLAERQGVVDPWPGGVGQLLLAYNSQCIALYLVVVAVAIVMDLAAADLELLQRRAAADEQQTVHEVVQRPGRPG